MPRRSPIRRGLLWWFGPPHSPWMSTNFAVDFSASRSYLEALSQRPGAPRVTVQHLIVATLGRVYRDFPEANARVVRRRIYRHPHVAVAAPVNLLGHADGPRELSMMVSERVEQRSLAEIAEEGGQQVRAERSGEVQDPFMRRLLRWIDATPDPILFRGLDALDLLTRSHLVASLSHHVAPATVGLTNPGAAIRDVEGALFRGAAANLPDRLVRVGTLWAVAPLQDEVIAIDGRPEVRPMLPVLFNFDHRLFDGVKAGRIAARFVEILRSPEETFGADARALPGGAR